MQIRGTTASDIVHLAEVERSATQAYLSINDLGALGDGSVQAEEAHLRWVMGGASWVAVDDLDRPIGFLAGEVFDDELHVWELDVHFENQQRGIGRALVETAKDWASQRGLRQITLTTFRDIPWNAPFYASCGFEIVPGDQLPLRLSGVRALEARLGLPAELRCAMRCRLITT